MEEGGRFELQPPAAFGGGNNRDEEVQEVQNIDGNGNSVPRPKRVACVVCRKRKLRCDGAKPSCASCARLGHECAYNEVRKKSGPKRGYVKQLEARLAQVETLLKSQDAPDSAPGQRDSPPRDNSQQFQNMGMPNNSNAPQDASNVPFVTMDTFTDQLGPEPNLGDESSWEMISLGLEEPLPTQDVIDELNEIYFAKVHPSLSMIHRGRYYAAMNLAPSMRPPACLRYIMWAHAASRTDKYLSLHSHFYQRARKYAEKDQMKGLGEAMTSIAHCQCWVLVGMYEFKMMYFPRAWISAGHASRLAFMTSIHRIDGGHMDVKQCLPPPRDWTEKEEMRRTFWAAFCQDRYASIGTGWPMMMDERDISTNLPASDEAYMTGEKESTSTLSQLMTGSGMSSLSPFGGVILIACLFGRNLHHLHRTSPKDNDSDLNGEFWKRHRLLDNLVLSTCLMLPTHLRLPEAMNDPSVVFTNMSLHASTICLHQAAIFKAEENNMPARIIADSKRRCIIASDEITNIMKMISHTDLSMASPFTAFCLYVACRIYIRYLKSRPGEPAVLSSLQFLLSALNALKSHNPLTESFLVQLDVDLEGSDLEVSSGVSKFAYGVTGPGAGAEGRPKCVPILEPPRNPRFEDPQNANAQAQPSTGTNNPTAYSLPSRSGKTPVPQSGINNTIQAGQGTHTEGFGSLSITQTDFNEDQIRSLVMELDGSTEVSNGSDRHPSASDHATPCTNKSSNSSFSPQNNQDHPSPKRHQQQQSQHLSANTYPTTTTSATSTPPSLFDNTGSTQTFSYYATASDIPTDPSAQNPFAFSAGWDYPIRQPRENEPAPGGGTGMTPGDDTNLANLDDMSWQTLSNVMDWSGFSQS